ncbi:glycosyltransferase [Roseivirga misakiensis]|uniref:Glycosyltransferase 2-like domain-containing protein n=1 Tax=Roseivirga misakiensis TaxID=1563681 RepID=A0A1E5T1V5_9BACT|nr:glycosyltransferase [Roseivirga misakiensis]OEK05339.1 hypothetical protein BFP71_18270 [Roseivirga misakiensis]
MIVLILVYSIYLLLIIAFTALWARGKAFKDQSKYAPVSVVIPFRNEAQNLSPLVSSLKNQTHPDFEVLFVDDHSDDNGTSVLEDLLQDVSFKHRLLSLKKGVGKKAALALGISESTNELIITTDADCEMSSEWLKEMTIPFHDEKVKLLVGPVGLQGNSFWQRMQSMESTALIGVGGTMIFHGKPTMANGANLAYRKAVFSDVNGFDGISGTPSGDDELLMHKVANRYTDGIAFCKSKKAVVKTAAMESWQLFKQQRLRWASKWNYGKRGSTMAIALFVFLIQLVQILLLGLILFKNDFTWQALSLVVLRLLIELIFLWSVRRSLGQRTHWLPTFFSYLLYPFYAIYIGVAANFGTFEWKGRNYNVKQAE